MCDFASFVLTKDKVFWSDSNSHTDIIKEFGLHEYGANGPNILKVEIFPTTKIKYLRDYDNWEFKIDQDIMPEWYNKDLDESRTRKALKIRFAKDFKVPGYLDLIGCTGLKSLPSNLKVPESLNLSGCTGLKSLPSDLEVGRYLYLNRCTGLKSLPSDLKVAGSLNLSGCTGLKSLPNNLKVGGSLYLTGCTGLKSLPSDLKVTGYLYLPEHLK
jgi:hypothetical protein